ncbi:hypothetical protein ACJMK2_000375 [Sinanodonta woodiana]|uniref:G-protein coupled receptors family 1 profile domain-containing protein n=1 Tax=Sinanodonta woodiana TaxID=1069815 RepID=A0ABD3XPB6_SINWO
MNNSSTSLLLKLNDEKAVHLVPAMVFVGVLMVIGLIGNIFVCYYYGWKTKTTPTSCFILGLAIFGLLNCILSMPMEIVDMRYFYMFPDVTVCKVLRATNFMCIFASGFILIAIATERYRRICLPFRKQISVCQSKLICGISTIIACVLSCPSLVLYTVVTVDIPVPGSDTIQGHDCTTVKDVSLNVFLNAFNIMQILLFIVSSMALIFLYALVYRQLIKQKHFRKYGLMEERVSSKRPVVANSNTSSLEKSTKSEYMPNCCCKNTEVGISDTFKKANNGSNSTRNSITQVRNSDTENEISYMRDESTELTENNRDNKHEFTNRIAIEQIHNQVQLEKERYPIAFCENDGTDLTKQPSGTLTNDTVSPANDNLSPANDNVSPAKDNVSPAYDNVSPANDNVSSANDNVSQSNDNGSPVNDNVSPANDNVSQSNDNVSPANDNVSPANDNVSHVIDNVSPANDTKVPRFVLSLSKKTSSDISTVRYTTLMLVITVTFIVSFLPYLCLMLWRSLLSGYEVNQMTDLQLIFFSIGIRSYFLNSAMNPMIYGFFNSQFRKFFTRFCCTCSEAKPY